MKNLLLLALLVFFFPSQSEAARIYNVGAELNSTTDGMETGFHSGMTPLVVSSTSRSGTYAYWVNPTGSAPFWRQAIFSSNQATTGFLSAHIRVDKFPAGSTQIIRFSNGANAHLASLRLQANQTLTLNAADNSAVGSASTALATSTWYCIELKNNGATTTNALEGRLDGVSFASGNNTSSGAWGRVLWGSITSATDNIYFDDILVNDSTGSVQLSYAGCDNKLIRLKPNAAGDNNAWLDTAGSAGTTNNYQLVDEVTPNDATDFVQSATLNAKDYYNVENSGIDSYDTVNVVSVLARLNNPTADAVTEVKLGIKKTAAGTLTQGTGIIPNSTSWTSEYKTLVTYTDPDAAAWTQTTLDTMQIGQEITLLSVFGIQISAVWAYVDYTDGSPPASSPDDGVVWFD